MARPGTTKAHGRKHALDKFYTKPAVARACVAHLDLSRYARAIEPSAGAGAFLSPLREATNLEVLALDIAPEAPGIIARDWFAYDELATTPTLVVGNPPFGQQSSLAVRFVNHAFDLGAETVAFILPRGFRKASVQRRLHPLARLVLDVALDPSSFELDGCDYDLPAVFQVFERAAAPRRLVRPATTSPHLVFTRADEPHDFAVRRVGGRAGHAFVDDGTASPQSNYFVRLAVPQSVEEIIDLVNGIDFSVADDGTGPRTLAKSEFVALFDAAYAGRSSRDDAAA